MESTRGVCVLQVSPLIAFPTTLPCRAYELRNYSRFLLLHFHRNNPTSNRKKCASCYSEEREKKLSYLSCMVKMSRLA